MNKSQVMNFIIEVVVTDRFHCITWGPMCFQIPDNSSVYLPTCNTIVKTIWKCEYLSSWPPDFMSIPTDIFIVNWSFAKMYHLSNKVLYLCDFVISLWYVIVQKSICAVTSHKRQSVSHRQNIDCLFNFLFGYPQRKHQGPLLLTWFYFNPSMDK